LPEIGGILILGAVMVGTLRGGKDPSMIPFGGMVIGGIEIGGVVSVGVARGGAIGDNRYHIRHNQKIIAHGDVHPANVPKLYLKEEGP
jgi:hypothetical protein